MSKRYYNKPTFYTSSHSNDVKIELDSKFTTLFIILVGRKKQTATQRV